MLYVSSNGGSGGGGSSTAYDNNVIASSGMPSIYAVLSNDTKAGAGAGAGMPVYRPVYSAACVPGRKLPSHDDYDGYDVSPGGKQGVVYAIPMEEDPTSATSSPFYDKATGKAGQVLQHQQRPQQQQQQQAQASQYDLATGGNHNRNNTYDKWGVDISGGGGTADSAA